MRFKGNERLHETSRPDPAQKEERSPRDAQGDDFSTIEASTQSENMKEDEANVEEIEQVSKDYFGRRSQETDGAVPTEPPDKDPVVKHFLRKPKGPPEHNM